MAGNLGFSQVTNLLEVTDGAKVLQNLGGGTIDADLRLFAGSSTRKSDLFWDRFEQTINAVQSPTELILGTRLEFGEKSTSTFSDKDIIKVNPVNLIKDIAFKYIGFDADGLLLDTNGSEITFIRGEKYTQGTYPNVELTGGTGSGARANIVVNSEGEVESVEITNNGSNYVQGDVLSFDGLGANGNGFIVRIVGFPWKCLVVLNFAYDAILEVNSSLSLEIKNTVSSLDGTYFIRKDPTTNKNAFYEPNDSSLQSYDVNRLQFAQTRISNNIDIFDIDGDGAYTSYDSDLIAIYLNNLGSTSAEYEALFTTYVNSNPPNSNARRNNAVRINNYFTGISLDLFDIDGTGLFDITINTGLFADYATNGFLYQVKSASNVINNETPNNSINFNHTNIIDFRIPRDPNYTLPTNLQNEYVKPYVKLLKTVGGSTINIFDNFSLLGTTQECTTNQQDYQNNVVVGTTNTEFNYQIVDKFVSNNQFFVRIVVPGSGKPLNVPFGNIPELTPISSTPVFVSTDEYGVFDSNVIDNFFLKTNPRSNNDNLKELILFSNNYSYSSPPGLSGSSTYETQQVSINTLLPDLLLERDDTLETENILNLDPPDIIDDGEQFLGTNRQFNFNQNSFSYNVDDGYGQELKAVTNTVDESLFLRTTKYRTDKSLYYKRDIKINGLISSYDPDAFNDNATSLNLEKSPGIYISDSTSQITNTLASDFARKTRSFSSNYNPWRETTGALSTFSLNVTINDLFWTTEISLNIGRSGATTQELANMGYETGITGETLDTNFNSTTVAAGESYKLPTVINGEVFFIIMKKS